MGSKGTNQVKRSEAEVTEHERELMDEVRQEIGTRTKRFQHRVLTALRDEVQPTIDVADKLIAMEGKVRAIYAGLDTRTKAFITILEQLWITDGESVGVDYGAELVDEFWHNRENVEQALKEHPQDMELKFLAEAYGLAKIVCEDDGDSAEAQPAEPEQAEEPEAEITIKLQAEPEKMLPPEITETTRLRLINFFETLDRRSKLAIQLHSDLMCLDGISFDHLVSREERLDEKIRKAVSLDLGRASVSDPEESWLVGVWQSCQMILQCT